MSNQCSRYDFDKQFQSYRSAYTLADQWQRGDALQDFVTSLRRLNYISVGRSEVTTKNHPMIEVKSQFALAKRLPELVQIDLTTVWKEASKGASHACHAYEWTPSGFDAHFLLVQDSAAFTFCIHVVGTH